MGERLVYKAQVIKVEYAHIHIFKNIDRLLEIYFMHVVYNTPLMS